MLYSIDDPRRDPPRLSAGIRAVLVITFLLAVIVAALYFLDRFAGVAMVLGG